MLVLGSRDLDPTTGPHANPCHSCLGGLVTIKGPVQSSPEQHSRGIWDNQAPACGAESPRVEWGRQPGSEKESEYPGPGFREKHRDWDTVPGLRRVPSPGARPHPWRHLSSSPGFRGWSAALRWGRREAHCWDQGDREARRGRAETEQNVNAGLSQG